MPERRATAQLAATRGSERRGGAIAGGASEKKEEVDVEVEEEGMT